MKTKGIDTRGISACAHWGPTCVLPVIFFVLLVTEKSVENTDLPNMRAENFYGSLISNPPFCLLHYSYDASSENLSLDQLTITEFIILFISILCLLDIVLVL